MKPNNSRRKFIQNSLVAGIGIETLIDPFSANAMFAPSKMKMGLVTYLWGAGLGFANPNLQL